MSSPFDIEVVAEVERQRDSLALQFIDDGAVVNALDRNLLAILLIEELAVLLADLRDADGSNAEHLLGQQEVGTRLLLFGMDFHQDDIFGIVSGDDGVTEQLLV